VIDPVSKRVTHLVVQPRHDPAEARLVPVERAKGGAEGQPEISLDCTVEEVRGLGSVQEFAYLRVDGAPVDDPEWDVGIQDVLAMPYYESDLSPAAYAENTGVIFDRIPKGEVEVRRTSPVTSADGHHLGHVDGFIVDGDEITHVVLEHGHLWGRRDITIPIGSVAKVENDVVTLGLSKDEVEALGGVPVRRWHRARP
jgi:hypothetical protein